MNIEIISSKRYDYQNIVYSLKLDGEDACYYCMNMDDDIIRTIKDITEFSSGNNAQKLLTYKRLQNVPRSMEHINFHYSNKLATISLGDIIKNITL